MTAKSQPYRLSFFPSASRLIPSASKFSSIWFWRASSQSLALIAFPITALQTPWRTSSAPGDSLWNRRGLSPNAQQCCSDGERGTVLLVDEKTITA